MAETVEAFACPKCGKIIEYGTHPCPFCGMPITWEGFTPPAREQVAVTSVVDEGTGYVPPSVGLSVSDIETVRTPVVEEVTAVTVDSMRAQPEPTAAFQQAAPSQNEASIIPPAQIPPVQSVIPPAQPSTTVAEASVSSTYSPLSQTVPFPSQQAEGSLTSQVEIPPAPQIEVLSASQVRVEPTPDPIPTLVSVPDSVFASDTESSPVSIPVQTLTPAPLSVEALTPAPALSSVLNQALDRVPVPDSTPDTVSALDGVSEPAPVLSPTPLSVPASIDAVAQDCTPDIVPDIVSDIVPDAPLIQASDPAPAPEPIPAPEPDPAPDSEPIPTPEPDPAPDSEPIPTPEFDFTRPSGFMVDDGDMSIPTPEPDPAPALAPVFVLDPAPAFTLPSSPASDFGLTPEATSLYPSARAEGQHFRPAEALYESDTSRYFVDSPSVMSSDDDQLVEQSFSVPEPAPLLTPSAASVLPALTPVPVPVVEAAAPSTLEPASAPSPEPASPPEFIPAPAPTPPPEFVPAPIIEPSFASVFEPEPTPVSVPEPVPAPAPVPEPTFVPEPILASEATTTGGTAVIRPLATMDVMSAPASVSGPVIAPVAAPALSPIAESGAAAPALSPIAESGAVTAAAITAAPASAPVPSPAPASVSPSAMQEPPVSDEPLPTVNVPSGVVRRLPRRGAGASFLAAVLKALAVLIWLGTVAIIVIPGFDVISDSFSNDLTATLSALMNNDTVVAALIGLVLGFVFFGLGEIIGLLNTIRRNTR